MILEEAEIFLSFQAFAFGILGDPKTIHVQIFSSWNCLF